MKEFMDRNQSEQARLREQFRLEHNLTGSYKAGRVNRDSVPMTGEQFAPMRAQFRECVDTNWTATQRWQLNETLENAREGRAIDPEV